MFDKEYAIQSIVLMLLGFSPDTHYIIAPTGEIRTLKGDMACVSGDETDLVMTMLYKLQQASDEKIMIMLAIIRRFN